MSINLQNKENYPNIAPIRRYVQGIRVKFHGKNCSSSINKKIISIIEKRIHQGKLIEQQLINRIPAVDWAIHQKNTPLLTYLFSKTKNLLRPDSYINNSPLFTAYNSNSTAMMDYILDLNAKPDVQDIYGKTILHYAARDNNIPFINLMLKYNANPNILDNDGFAPLHIATIKNHIEAISTLSLSPKINLDILNLPHKQAPLHIAINNSSLEAITTLLQRGATPNVQDNHLLTPLHLAIKKCSNEIILAIFKYAETVVDTSIQDNKGHTALHIAARLNNISALSILLNHPYTFIDLQDKVYKETALHKASDKQNWECVKELLIKGANPSITNYEIMTPFHYALSRNIPKALDLFLPHTPDFHIRNDEGRSPMTHILWDPIYNETMLEKLRTTQPKLVEQTPKLNFFNLSNVMLKRILTNVFSIKDNEFNGAFFHFHPFINDALGDFIKIYQQYTLQFSLTKHALDKYPNTLIQNSEEIVSEILSQQPIIISPKISQHLISIVFYKQYIAICNRGKIIKNQPKVIVANIKNAPRDSIVQVIQQLIFSDDHPDEQQEFIYVSMPILLQYSQDITSTTLTKLLSNTKSQKIGNCTITQAMLATKLCFLLDQLLNSFTYKEDNLTNSISQKPISESLKNLQIEIPYLEASKMHEKTWKIFSTYFKCAILGKSSLSLIKKKTISQPLKNYMTQAWQKISRRLTNQKYLQNIEYARLFSTWHESLILFMNSISQLPVT